MKKLTPIIIALIIILGNLSPLLTTEAGPLIGPLQKQKAENPTKAQTPSTDLTEGTFPVNEILTLDKKDQPKKYFEDKENSPVVSFILEIIDFATTVMGSIAVLLLIIAGFMFMFAHGNQQDLEKAKELVKYAVLGLIVAFLSYIIVVSVQSIFVAD